MEKKLIELWFTNNGRRESIEFSSIMEGKKELASGKYKDAILDVRPIDRDGDYISGAEYWYTLKDGKIIKC